jgi:Flp pilus assembly protein TadD
MLQQLGYPQAASADLRRALLHCPARWDLGLPLAAALAELGRCGEAEPLLERALAHDAKDAQTWIVRGACRQAAGDVAGARAAWERAAALDPSDPRPPRLLQSLGR